MKQKILILLLLAAAGCGKQSGEEGPAGAQLAPITEQRQAGEQIVPVPAPLAAPEPTPAPEPAPVPIAEEPAPEPAPLEPTPAPAQTIEAFPQGTIQTFVELSGGPKWLAFDSKDNLFVSTPGLQKVVKVSPSKEVTTVITLTQASPQGIAVDSQDNLYIAENALGDSGKIHKITPSGDHTVIEAGLTAPEGMAVLGNNIFVAEPGLNQLIKVAPNGSKKIIGQPHLNLSRPHGLATDPVGDLYIGDFGFGRILRIQAADFFPEGGGASIVAQVPSAGIVLVRDASGIKFLTTHFSNSTVTEVTFVPANIDSRTIAGTGTAGFSGDGGEAIKAQLNTPVGIARDSKGFLYIADLGNNRIRIVSPK